MNCLSILGLFNEKEAVIVIENIINIKKVIKLYNNYFGAVLSLVIISLIFVAFSLYLKNKNESDEKWYCFVYTLKKKLIEMLVMLLFTWILILFLNETFSIDLIKMIHLSKYWKLIFGIWVWLNIVSGKKLYDRLNFSDFIQKVKKGNYRYTSPENIMLEIIDRYNANYVLQVERLGILKSLTPISLIPLIAGYVIEGKNIEIDWNWYTVVFFAILFIYFYNLWKCYKNIQFWKIRVLEVQKELRNVQYQSDEK